MRFIKKSNDDDLKEFNAHVNDNAEHLPNSGKWNLPTNIKNGLHSALWKKQQGLCVYCEQQIPKKTEPEHLPKSIIEHVRPRKKYPELTYVACNLAVSCSSPDICDDIKKDEYDNDLFLNPLEVENIEDHFEYDIEGFISHKSEKAFYMINKVLNLNSDKLKTMRREQYLIFLERSMDLSEEIFQTADDFYNELSKNENKIINILLDEKAEQLPSFYSMLKQFFHI